MFSEATCVVPARLGSSRFPGKLLRPLAGKPVVVHALERASEAGCFAAVVCFTDSVEIADAVEAHGFRAVLTGEAANGTERIGRNLSSIETELIVNLQGDEPAFPPEGLRTLCAALRRHPEWAHTLVEDAPPSHEELENPNRVKAVLDAEGFITGFTREILGGPHGAQGGGDMYRLQSGAYGYSRGYLARYAALPPSKAEIALSHELLRAPELAPLRAHAAPAGASVDVPADLAGALRALEKLEPQARLQGTAP